ncbi:MAG: phosphoribosylglycinamide formyltransferase [Candidatus Omnitrophota bacterium]
MNIAVFISGNGSNLKALIDAESAGRLGGGSIALVVSDKPGAYGLERARAAGIETCVLRPREFSSREEYDRAVRVELEKKEVGLIALAGFMRILSDSFVDEYYGRMINIHPSLLPSFKGVQGIKDAYEYGVKITGVTVHFVNRELDGGPVILQESVRINEDDSTASLEEKIHRAEHEIYPEAVRLFVSGKLKIEGNKVRVLK